MEPISRNSTMTMTSAATTSKGTSEVVVRCRDALFQKTQDFYTALRDGDGAPIFHTLEVFPADGPREVMLEGPAGLLLRIAKVEAGFEDCSTRSAPHLRIGLSKPPATTSVCAPNGAHIEFYTVSPTRAWLAADSPCRHLPVPLALPALEHNESVISHSGREHFEPGRAGMLYRDLVPTRLGGAFIASAICIPEGGPVPDYTHFHLVRFQCIYCVRGWVRLAYEGEGPPFVMQAGDLVIQPPTIRHQVLHSSDRLEVLEVAVPAEHITRADRQFQLLPSSAANDEVSQADQEKEMHANKRRRFSGTDEGRRAVFGGQRFVHFQAASVEPGCFRPAELFAGLLMAHTGVKEATDGTADVQLCRRAEQPPSTPSAPIQQPYPLLFARVNVGSATLHTSKAGAACQGETDIRVTKLNAGDTYTVPKRHYLRLCDVSPDFEQLVVLVREYA